MADLCLVEGANINTLWLQETYLNQGIRQDGRKYKQKRPVEHQVIVSLDDHIVVELKLGYTTVVCSISAKMVCPYQDRPEEGLFRITTIQGYNGVRYESGQLERKWIHILRIMEKIEYLDRKKRSMLCITPGSLVWSVEASMTILNDDGSSLDALFMALMFASKSFSLFAKCNIVLPELCMASFAIKERNFLVDPTLIEEQLTGNNILTICVDLDRKVCTNIYYNHSGKPFISKDHNDMSCILDECLGCIKQ